MSLKVVSGLMLTSLLASMVLVVFDVPVVVASGTIYIRADGSIDPPTAAIATADNITYTVTGNIYDSIVIERNNIVVDGAGYTLQGTNTYESRGTYLTGRSNVTIKNMTIKAFSYGIVLDSSSNYNSVSGNNITANNVFGIYIQYSSNNNSISGNNIANNDWGIRLEYSSNNSVSGNNITANINNGIFLGSSSSNSVSGNNITNGWDGIVLYPSSNNNSISGNNIAANINNGIWLYSSSNYNSISGNNIAANNGDGIVLYPSSNNNSISGNNIAANNWVGILLSSSLGNSISGNNIANNDCGILFVLSSSGNIIFHNNFINNINQVDSLDSVNVWDNGYPSGGNYWSDYEERYPDAEELDGSGIWDTPYVIDADNQDNYPLMSPFVAPLHDVAITSVVPSKTVVGQGYSLNINVTVGNQGDYTETFNVTVYANTTMIETKTNTTLTSGNSTTISFTWNTSGFAKGNYTLSAEASQIPGETDLDDNNCTDGWILITKVGDLGGLVGYIPTFFACDGKIDGIDLALFIQCYKKLAGDAQYLGDLGGPVNYVPTFYACDGKVDGIDLALFIACYKGLGPPDP